MIPVILAGGSGTRLWPLSRKLFPKQVMPVLGGDQSLLQSTAERVMAIPETTAPIVVTNEYHRFIVASQMQECGVTPSSILLEPVGRNTAPAVCVAALYALELEDDPDLLIVPSDHYIQNTQAFSKAVCAARRLTDEGNLVTFGIVPQKPETGYGYIRAAGEIKNGSGLPISEFVEKPDLKTAEQYLQSGEYFWNSGMFVFKARIYIEELGKFEPEMLEACRAAMTDSQEDLDFLRLGKDEFSQSPDNSIDYAIMERTDSGMVIPLDCGWNDVGSWTSLHEVKEKDQNGNVSVGDSLIEDSKGCYVHSSGRLVAALGLENIAIVETADAVLVSDLNSVQQVKKVVDALRSQDRPEAEIHRKVFRPWGHYECINSAERYQVKRIIVYPGQILSLQKHFHRAEHWVVVKGTALVTNGDEKKTLSRDQSTYIPLGNIHRLENPGKENLELIEVQTGSYLGEDDIVRLEDSYGRLEFE